MKSWKCSNVVINNTSPFVSNSTHRGLSCHRCKKKFFHHKILANFHVKSSPFLPIIMGVGAQTNYNQINFIFKEWLGTILSMVLCYSLSFVNQKNEKKKQIEVCQWKLYLLLLRYYFSKQLMCILYTYSQNMQTTETSST